MRFRSSSCRATARSPVRLAAALLSLVGILIVPNALARGLFPRQNSLALLINSFSVSPGTISFTANDPSNSPAAISTIANFIFGLGVGSNAWTLNVAAASTALTNCPSVPASAVQISCSSVAVTGITGYTAACAAPVSLSTTPQTIASGMDGSIVSIFVSHIVTSALVFSDSWKYPASGGSSCSVSLTYTLTRN